MSRPLKAMTASYTDNSPTSSSSYVKGEIVRHRAPLRVCLFSMRVPLQVNVTKQVCAHVIVCVCDREGWREEGNRHRSGAGTRASLQERPAETLSYIPSLFVSWGSTEEEEDGMKDEG